MKKKKNLLLTLLILSMGIFFSCNNNKPKSEEESTVTPSTTPPTTKAATVASGNTFYTLRLDSASLATLLADKDTKKLIVQFTYNSPNDTALSLVAYGAKANNVKTSGPVTLTPLSNPVTTYAAPVILGDQELTLKSIKTIYGLPHSGGKIGADKFANLQFVPLKDGNNHIYYSVTKLGMTEADGSALTNPSPPAPPCENGCDY